MAKNETRSMIGDMIAGMTDGSFASPTPDWGGVIDPYHNYGRETLDPRFYGYVADAVPARQAPLSPRFTKMRAGQHLAP